MSLGALYQQDIDKALDLSASLPATPPPKPARGIWATLGDSLAGAGARISASVLEVGKVAGAAATIDMNTEESLAVLKGDPDRLFRENDLSRQFRDFERALRPDPATAGEAEKIVYGLAGPVATLIGSAVLGGLPGVAAASAEMGFSEAEDLAREGVGLGARSAVGAVTAVTNTAFAALPMMGQTLKATAGLYLTGGPGAFIAQQSASRAILEAADYSAAAEKYDPLDPTGLALSFLIPAPFAAYGAARNVRANRAAAAGSDPVDVPSATEVGTKRPAAAAPEQVDAAMTHNLTLMRQAQDEALPELMVRPPEPGEPQAPARPVVQNKAGEEFFDTRGQGLRLHGTGKPIAELSDDYALSGDSRNIYGQGFYTTDAADIAAGYMKKGGKQSALYEVTVAEEVRLFDMEAPIADDVATILKANMGDDLPTENAETGALLLNLREVYDEYRAQSRDLGLSRDDVQEVFDGIRYRLEELGYRGFKHLGGLQTGSRAHDVQIFWYPERDVSIRPASLDEYKPGAARQEVAKPPPPPDLSTVPDVAAAVYGPEFTALESATDSAVRNVATGLRQAATDARDIGAALTRAADEFRAMRERGDSPDTLADRNLPPDVNNLVVGLVENARSPARVAELVRQLATATREAKANKAPTADAAADVVERMRKVLDSQVEAAAKPTVEPMLKSINDRVTAIEVTTPDLPVRVEDGKVTTAKEEMAAARKEAAEGTDEDIGLNEVDLVRVAAECALASGAY